MSLSVLCVYSQFIDVLVKNCYDDTLTALLRDLNLDITCSTNDIIALLNIINNDNNDIINKLGIAQAITICDELCAYRAVNIIIKKKIVLDKLSEHQIINHNDLQDHINIYNRGYRIIVGNAIVCYREVDLSSINNAYNNGLYAPRVYMNGITNNNIGKILPCVLNDIREIHNTELKIVALCKNVELIDELYCDGTELPLPFAKNIKNITMWVFNTHCINLEQFTRLRKFDGGKLSCDTQLPSTLNMIYAKNLCLTNKEIATCVRLKKLIACGNPNITTCEPFAQHLVVLDVRNVYSSRFGFALGSGICDKGLHMCNRLKILYASNNTRITSCEPFAKTLRKLDASNDCGINDIGLQMCHRLKILNASDNSQITTCKPFARSLKELHARGDCCGIDNDGIALCANIRILYSYNNNKISQCYQ